MVSEEVGTASNVTPLFADREVTPDKEKEIINYVAQRLAEAREKGLQTDSIMFCLLGTMTDGKVSHPDGVSLHYWIDESRHISKELAFIEKVLAAEIQERIDDMHVS